jgi:N6-adenosine-specific RNA methylase IME4
MQAWGFSYKTILFVWVKVKRKDTSLQMGMGYYTRSNSELMLLGMRGHVSAVRHNINQVIIASRGLHSRKPNTARKRIEQLFGDVPRIELFARATAPGWDAWGNQCNVDNKLLQST